MDDDRQYTHEHPPLGGAIGGGQECLVCPVCVLLQAVNGARPEVFQHLLAAGRELTLALQAIVDSQASASDRADQKVQRIHVE